MCSSVAVNDFISLSLGVDDALPLALVVPEGIVMTSVPVCNDEGTFLARSANPRARVVASLTGLHEMEHDHAWTW